uniref:HECT domain-containing protein n=1 Tax=Macrostomum lignano TaxID=282301 RepID=A0A1I8FV27_9PLAT
ELALQRLLSENPQLGGDPSRRRLVGPGVECWESSDGRLKFYLGDLFSDSLLTELKSSCQLVWDRGSLVAIDVPDRDRYVRCLKAMCETQHV